VSIGLVCREELVPGYYADGRILDENRETMKGLRHNHGISWLLSKSGEFPKQSCPMWNKHGLSLAMPSDYYTREM